MKKLSLIMFALFVGLSVSNVSFAQDKKEMKESEEKMETMDSQEAMVVEVSEGTPENTICPVSREPIEDDAKLFTYKGHTFATCCGKCLKKVKADPEKYLSKLIKEDDSKMDDMKKDNDTMNKEENGAGALLEKNMDNCSSKSGDESCCSSKTEK